MILLLVAFALWVLSRLWDEHPRVASALIAFAVLCWVQVDVLGLGNA